MLPSRWQEVAYWWLTIKCNVWVSDCKTITVISDQYQAFSSCAYPKNTTIYTVRTKVQLLFSEHSMEDLNLVFIKNQSCWSGTFLANFYLYILWRHHKYFGHHCVIQEPRRNVSHYRVCPFFVRRMSYTKHKSTKTLFPKGFLFPF